MKVLLITPLPPAIGGIARWSEVYLQWSKGQFETVVVNNARLDTGSSRISRYLSQVKRTFGILGNLTRAIRAGDIDIAHVNSSCAKLGMLRDYLCIKKLHKKSIPVVLQCHCNIEDQLGHSHISRIFFTKAVQLAAQTLVLNSTSFDFAKGCGAVNVRLCPNFISAEKISQIPHGIHFEIKKAVYVGHLYKDKGVEMIIEVAKQHPQIEFRLIGPYTEEYHQQSTVPENVILTGPKNVNGVMAELDEADLFLLLSYSEGFSNAMLEAMARGVPIIATDVGAAADMIEGRGGVVVAVEDIDGVSQAIRTMNDAEVRRKMSEQNRKKAADCYESKTVLNDLKECYLEIIYEEQCN